MAHVQDCVQLLAIVDVKVVAEKLVQAAARDNVEETVLAVVAPIVQKNVGADVLAAVPMNVL